MLSKWAKTGEITALLNNEWKLYERQTEILLRLKRFDIMQNVKKNRTEEKSLFHSFACFTFQTAERGNLWRVFSVLDVECNGTM